METAKWAISGVFKEKKAKKKKKAKFAVLRSPAFFWV